MMGVLLNLWTQFNLTVFTNRSTRRVDEVDDIDERWKDYRDGCTPRRDTAYRSVLITLRFVRIVRFNLRKASNLYEGKTMRPGGSNNTAICTRRLLRGRRFNLTVSATREASLRVCSSSEEKLARSVIQFSRSKFIHRVSTYVRFQGMTAKGCLIRVLARLLVIFTYHL